MARLNYYCRRRAKPTLKIRSSPREYRSERLELKRSLRILDDPHHCGGVRSGFEGLAKFFVVQKFCDVGQRVKMFLELALGHEEQHD
jgi:hypothetical protein